MITSTNRLDYHEKDNTNTSYEKVLSNALLRKSHIELGEDNKFFNKCDTTYSSSMVPHDVTINKVNILKPKNFVSSSVIGDPHSQNTYSTEFKEK